MSKYDVLWKWISENRDGDFFLSFEEIEKISGFPPDHSFLTYKKELNEYGFTVVKISMKENKVIFKKGK